MGSVPRAPERAPFTFGDPNGIAVECCCTTRAFTPDDATEADTLRRAARPPLGQPMAPEVYEATTVAARG